MLRSILQAVSPNNSNTIKTYTGLSRVQFDQVFNITSFSLHQKFKNKQKSMIVLYSYFMKLKTDQTYAQMAPHFNVSPRTISSWVRTVREIVYKDFVPLHLFIRERNDILANTTQLSRKLYDVNNNTAMLIWDGTYVYTIKSSNLGFQKNTYSMQKYRNLVKFMMCVTTNGLIIGAFGPFEAKKNDAAILREIMNQPDNIFQNLREGDIFIVDRGFRDCIPELRARNFVVKMPELLTKNATALTNPQANKSRMVTKTRFVVEARNSHVKCKWKHLDGVKNHQSLPYMKKDFQIGAALVNAFCAKVVSDENDWERIVNKMLTQFSKPNLLSRIVGCRLPSNIFTRVCDLTIHPKFNVEDLKIIAQGTYQIKQAPSYCQSYLNANDGHFITYVCDAEYCRRFCSELLEPQSNPVLLMTKLSSRFITAKQHKTFVLLDLGSHSERKPVIVAYCCSCKNGLRTVGCCSHVMTIIWYTIYVDKNKLPLPSSNLNHIFESDAHNESDFDAHNESDSDSDDISDETETSEDYTEQSSS